MLLGELLVSQGLATTADVKTALAVQELHGGRVGEHLIAMGAITREDLETALRRQYELAMVVLAREDLLSRAEKRHGADDPRTHRQRCQLARALTAAGRLGEAVEMAQRAYEGHLSALGNEHYWSIDSEQTLTEAVAAVKAAASPREGPAVATRIGTGEQGAVSMAVLGPPDDLDAARPFEVADHIDRVAAPDELTPDIVGEPLLHRQHVWSVMRIVGVLTGHH